MKSACGDSHRLQTVALIGSELGLEIPARSGIMADHLQTRLSFSGEYEDKMSARNEMEACNS